VNNEEIKKDEILPVLNEENNVIIVENIPSFAN